MVYLMNAVISLPSKGQCEAYICWVRYRQDINIDYNKLPCLYYENHTIPIEWRN